jgi:hypothetical protein
MAISAEQYAVKLGAWQLDIKAKMCNLDKSARLYTWLNYSLQTKIAMLSVALIGINSYFIGDPNISDGAKLGLNISVLVMQIILAFCNVSMAVIGPKMKATLIGMCGKLYSQICREIETKMEASRSDHEEDYSGLYLSDWTQLYMREQIILGFEPQLVFIGRSKSETSAIRTADFGPLTTEDVEFLIAMINRHRNRATRERLTQIFNQVSQALCERL